MLPDYPHKIFSDERHNFNLLMETLAMDAPNSRPNACPTARLDESFGRESFRRGSAGRV